MSPKSLSTWAPSALKQLFKLVYKIQLRNLLKLSISGGFHALSTGNIHLNGATTTRRGGGLHIWKRSTTILSHQHNVNLLFNVRWKLPGAQTDMLVSISSPASRLGPWSYLDTAMVRYRVAALVPHPTQLRVFAGFPPRLCLFKLPNRQISPQS